jgi:hypothetical protein
MGILLRTLAQSAVGFAVLVGPSSADELQVSRGQFAGGISGREPSPSWTAQTRVAPESLWFWTELRVSESQIADIVRRRALPLQHRWYRNVAGNPSDEDPAFVRDLEDLTDEKIAKLAEEAKSRGYFTYRTSSCRFYARPGKWVVAVTDAFGNSIECLGNRYCRFEIVVARDGQKSRDVCQ